MTDTVLILQDIVGKSGKNKITYAVEKERLKVIKDRGDYSYLIAGKKQHFIIFAKDENVKFKFI